MPETYGKRQRRDARTKKIAAREARRVARNARREQRALGEDRPDIEDRPDTDEDGQVGAPSDAESTPTP